MVRNVVFPLWAKRDHPHYRQYIHEFTRTQFLSREEIEASQLIQLQSLLKHAYKQCPFYRKRMDDVGFSPEHCTSLNALSKIPALTKRDIQDFGARMMAEGFPESNRLRNQTGGSTGSPLQFYVDKKRYDSRLASTVRHNLWAGLRPGDWFAQLWGARLDQLPTGSWKDWARNSLLYRRIELNTSSISEKDWAGFISRVRAKRPRVLLAYAHSAVLFAQHLESTGISDITFDSIIATAEVLMPEQRILLERVFKGRVFNRYGCREVSIIASECDRHEGMHVNSEAVLVEIVPDPALKGGAGKILVTDLLNFSMPLIRYEIGDVGEWSEKQCSCGRGLPLLQNVQGRTTDFLVLADGRKVSGPALTLVVADMADVRQVQFVQKSPAAIVLRVVPGNGYGESTRLELQKRLGLYLQGAASMQISEVETIASEVSGKYRFVVSEMESPWSAEAVAGKGAQ
ncbi:MAG: Phenylacetate-CoA ligase [Acidobacteriales bacterium]|nr:Phenylacetate-CoA ligase [Terriglobales bacterium]